VPMLLIGAIMGRIVGNVMVDIGGINANPTDGWIDPGVFALIGAAAFFGGVSRLTMSLTIIMIEITNDVHMLLPIMVAIITSKWVADNTTHSLYHALIEAKCLPFLNPEVTLHGVADGELEKHSIASLIGNNTSVRTLTEGETETFQSCAVCLADSMHGCYPLTDAEGHFVGTISRSHLTAVVVTGANGGGNKVLTHEELLDFEQETTPADIDTALEKCQADPTLAPSKVNLSPYINSSAVSLPTQFSLHRAYMIFRTMGMRHLVVTDNANKVVGILTRKDLMDYRLHDVIHPHGHGHH